MHGWPAAIREAQDAAHSEVRELFAQRGERSQKISDTRALRVVALWWWVLPVARIPRWVGALLAALLAGVGVMILARTRRGKVGLEAEL